MIMKSNVLYPALKTLILAIVLVACNNDVEEITDCDGSLSITVDQVKEAVVGRSDGSITVKSSGGSQPYLYSIDGVNFQQSSTFSGLNGGTYVITVQDVNECTNEVQAVVSEQPIVSFVNDIVPILETNCMIPTCHCDGHSLCFDNYETVKEYSIGIRDRTTQRAMPPAYSGKSLTDNEIELIANWVNQGAIDN
jgi:hypothetical protein